MTKRINGLKGVDVYLEKRKTREYVGQLTYIEPYFIFNYDEKYLYKDRSISLGPDLPLAKKQFTSKTLFPSFEDRIPSRKNPAYNEYCEMVGIAPSENDPLVLLSTLGRRGPSSFVFVPAFEDGMTSEELKKFRIDLDLTVREFSDLFDFSSATIHRIEKNKTSGKDALKRLEVYYLFPEVALYEVEKNGFKINDNKKQHVIDYLTKKIK